MALGLLAPLPACSACQPVAQVPLRVVEGFPIVAARIGAAAVGMVLDTGSEGNWVVPEAAASAGLRALPGVSVPVIGTGGMGQAPAVLVEGVRLGDVLLPPLAAPVAPLPVLPHSSPPIAGLLGVAPLLEAYDLELDGPAGSMRLFPAGSCRVPDGMAALPLETTDDREMLLPVRVNGQVLTAILDTGSRATLMTEAGARRVGLSAPVSANTARGVDGALLPVGHARAEIAVGEDVRRDAPVDIAPMQLGRAEMLLGEDYLGQRRVWVSFTRGVLGIAVPSPAASAR